MIQVAALLAAGVAAVGVLLVDRVGLMLASWTLGAVVLAGLAATGRGGAGAAIAARRGLLVELLGAWALAMGGLVLVEAAGTDHLARLPEQLLLRQVGVEALPWAGLGVVLAITARLGLPPLLAWPAATASAPPAARVFLHAALHPVTALVLWQRLDVWLLPWHRELALWLGCVGCLALASAALGEPHLARRAALVGASRWAAVWAAAAYGQLEAWTPWLLAGGLVAIQLATVGVRAPLPWRRALLLTGVAAAVPAGVPEGLLSGARPGFAMAPPTLLLHVATFMLLLTARRWWDDLAGRAPRREPARGIDPAPPALFLRAARLGRARGPVLALAEGTGRSLSRLVSTTDRVVLTGVAEGLGWIALGIGWVVAWLDRRGPDAVDRSGRAAGEALGRLATGMASGHPGGMLAWSLGLVLVLAIVGRTLS
jgi:hypothetical protein